MGDGWAMPTWERFEVLVDGRMGSNRPAFCDVFRAWPWRLKVEGAGEVALVGGRVKGEGAFRCERSLGECVPVTERAVERVGREKLWRLLELPLGCEVKLAYMGVAGEPPCNCCCCCCWRWM